MRRTSRRQSGAALTVCVDVRPPDAKRSPVNVLLTMAGAALLSAALFLLCYALDNKYTEPGPQAQSGVLAYGDAEQAAYPRIHLTRGWEIYRDRLLAPADFAQRAPVADEIVYIGQYGGFEGSDASRHPHGSATYRMRISLPDAPRRYALELPEIYSAYRLYIDGALMESFGEPDPDAYRARTGNASASFVASGDIDIVLAVSDFSHMYSGLVYPPAFGLAPDVLRLLDARLLLHAGPCFIALALAAFFGIAGACNRRNRPMILYGLLCLCFAAYAGYPLVKTVWRGGMAWYGVENLGFCAMLALAMGLQMRLYGGGDRLSRAFLAFAALACACAVLRAAFPTGDLRALAAYSALIGLYKWAAAICLTARMARHARHDMRGSHAMLAGIVAFDVALVMDRLLPMYEPIFTGWFIEMASAALVACAGIVLGQEIVRAYRARWELANAMRMAELRIAHQAAQYDRIAENIERTKAARHDLRHQLAALGGYLARGDARGAADYLADMSRRIPEGFDEALCENFAVNAVAQHYRAIARAEGIDASMALIVPAVAGRVPDTDLCVIVGNLLENAIEACRYVAEGERYLRMRARVHHGDWILVMDNSFDGATAFGAHASRKGGGPGIGLASVRVIAQRHGGSAAFEAEGTEFRSSVMLHMEA